MFLADDLDVLKKAQSSVGHAPLVETEDVPAAAPVYLGTPKVLPKCFGMHRGDDAVIATCNQEHPVFGDV